jgi:hypothetical protein
MAISFQSLIPNGTAERWHNGTGSITYSILSSVPNYYTQVDTDGNRTPDAYRVATDPYIIPTNAGLSNVNANLVRAAVANWNEVARVNLTLGTTGGTGTAGGAGQVTGNGTLVGGLGGPAGYGEVSPARNDDGYEAYSFAQTGLFASGMNFYGHTYTSFFVNTNGSISFGNGISQYTPTTISAGATPMIAPFWADVDTRVGNPVYVDFDTINHVITATWLNVGYFNQHISPTNSFQLQLYDRGGGDFDIVFRYQSINWSAGDASGGTNGLGGTAAHAGYTAGDGNATHRAEIPGSGDQTSMLNLEGSLGNTGAAGLWIYAVRNGQVAVGDITFGGYAFNQPNKTVAETSVQGFVSNEASGFFTGTIGTADAHGDVWLNFNSSLVSSAEIGSRGFRTYFHELGHAIGLHHPNDNGNDPNFTNLDTVMSYIAVPGADANDWPMTPMVMDVRALQEVYGANTTTRGGDTTYFGAAVPGTSAAFAMGPGGLIAGSTHHMIMTIWDGGGNDTISATNQTTAVKIDLNPGAYSTIGTTYQNIGIAQLYTNASGSKFGWIENAIGGSGNDELTGNDVANILDGRSGTDTLTGGAGDDRFVFGPHYGADTVKGFAAGAHTDDRIDLVAFHTSLTAAFSHASQVGSNTVFNFGGGDTLTLQGVLKTSLTAEDFIGLKVAQADFSGEGSSDILWRHDSGVVSEYQMNGTAISGGGFVSQPSNDWTVQGTGDFNGDGHADILWRYKDGTVSEYQMNGTAISGGGYVSQPSNDWKFQGIGDFNGDGLGDILWRYKDGTVSEYQMNGTAISGGGYVSQPGNDWKIQGIGDFNGDGRDDILWRHDSGVVSEYLMNGTAISGGGYVSQPGNDWKFQGIGDFNGDGRDDILWRHDSGVVSEYLMNGTAIVDGGFVSQPSNDWKVQKIADYNSDGHADILWRHDSGVVSEYLMNGTAIAGGGFVSQPDQHWVIL